MRPMMNRRSFLAATGAAGAAAAMPRPLWGAAENRQRFLIRAEQEMGIVSPLLHGQFAEHLGSCVYGGLWVGENSPVPNIHGYRKSAIEYLKELGVPVLRWPGGCFADDYHWREGIGPRKQRSRRVNIDWGNYIEDNSFGTHEFMGLCGVRSTVLRPARLPRASCITSTATPPTPSTPLTPSRPSPARCGSRPESCWWICPRSPW